MTILWRKLSHNAKIYHKVSTARPIFVEKTFVGGSKTAKFVNIFSLESFVLYGTLYFSPRFDAIGHGL